MIGTMSCKFNILNAWFVYRGSGHVPTYIIKWRLIQRVPFGVRLCNEVAHYGKIWTGRD
jgi:hypothetical protein